MADSDGDKWRADMNMDAQGKRIAANEGDPPMAGVRREHAVHLNDGSTTRDLKDMPPLPGSDLEAMVDPGLIPRAGPRSGITPEALEAMGNVERSKQVEFDHWAARLTTEGGTPERRFEVDVLSELDKVARMLVTKNKAYGNSALDPLRVFSKADAVEQILVRLDDKLSRLGRGHAAGEDPEFDIMGYLILLRIARKRRGGYTEALGERPDFAVTGGEAAKIWLRPTGEPSDEAMHEFAGLEGAVDDDEPTDEAMDEFDAAHHAAHAKAVGSLPVRDPANSEVD